MDLINKIITLENKLGKKAAVAPKGPYTMVIGIYDDPYSRQPSRTEKHTVKDLAEAVKVYTKSRTNSGLGGSQFGHGSLLKDGKEFGHISYNGRLWAGSAKNVSHDYEPLTQE